MTNSIVIARGKRKKKLGLRWVKGGGNADICNSDNYKNKVTRKGLFSLNIMKITE